MLDISLDHFFGLSIILFAIGLIGVAFNRKSLINVLFSLEIIFMSGNLNFVSGSAFFNKIDSQVYSLFSLCLLAIELGLGLCIVYLLFKKNKNINIEKL